MFWQKKAQIALFVILAIIIVAGIVSVVVLTSKNRTIGSLPQEFVPIENYYVDCLETYAGEAVKISQSQAGFIYLEDEQGSNLFPFSNKLDFLGMGIPYWYYISGNGIQKENIPSLDKVEKDLSQYFEKQSRLCDLKYYEAQGYEIFYIGLPKAKTKISSGRVVFELTQTIKIKNTDGKTATIDVHKVEVPSDYKKLYEIATKIYEIEDSDLFLEQYALDVIRLYAPTTGIELSCSPLIWSEKSIENNLKKALESNIPFIKLPGSYYSLNQKNHQYFVYETEERFNENINFLYSSLWPTKVEVNPKTGDLLTASPVGLGPEYSMLGFCVVPYHFVYDLSFPVLIQISSGTEIFQFPVIAQIDKNKPRQAEAGEAITKKQICLHKIQDGRVYTYDSSGSSLPNVSINFKCITDNCFIGLTEEKEGKAILDSKFPQCMNGFIIASKYGYVSKKIMISTNSEFSSHLYLDKLYGTILEVTGNGKKISEDKNILVSFISDDYSTSIYLPEQDTIKLAEGIYDVQVFVFEEGSIKTNQQTITQCTKVPASGIAGFLGKKTEECFEIEIPNEIENLIVGGGKSQVIIKEEDLMQNKKLKLNVLVFETPKKLEDIQKIYEFVEKTKVEAEFV